MKRIVIGLFFALLAGCATKAPSFDVDLLATPRPDGREVVITGWLDIGHELRLYSNRADLGKLHKRECISGKMEAGYDAINKRLDWRFVTVRGRLYTYTDFVHAGGFEASVEVEQFCANNLIFVASDIRIASD